MPPGTRLGRYEIIGELGTGGMATVYEGRALSVGGFARRVAIKYLHPHLLRDEQFVQMFMDEGRLAARIHHPNVVGVVDLVLAELQQRTHIVRRVPHDRAAPRSAVDQPLRLELEHRLAHRGTGHPPPGRQVPLGGQP